MRYLASLDGVDHEVEVEELNANTYRLRLGEDEFRVDLRRISAGSYSVLLGDRVFDFEITHEDGQMVMASRQGVNRITLADEAHRRRLLAGGRQASGKVELKAMMPGRVVALLVNPGDEVAAEQGVITIEAMKMENELKSPRAGKVIEVKVTPGQAVEKGELLVIIE